VRGCRQMMPVLVSASGLDANPAGGADSGIAGIPEAANAVPLAGHVEIASAGTAC
jgi:hypothetical protein